MIGRALSAVFIFFVRSYQVLISPWLGSNCRHQPTCSAYMIEALREWGPFRGLWLGLKRIVKCHPWGSKGFDPVPSKKHHGVGSD
jgi:putative membrane protein insertion efficiency factor